MDRTDPIIPAKRALGMCPANGPAGAGEGLGARPERQRSHVRIVLGAPEKVGAESARKATVEDNPPHFQEAPKRAIVASIRGVDVGIALISP